MSKDVLMFSPGYPAEMPYFTRGLAEVGARVWGLGDQPAGALPDVARRALTGYLQVQDLWDERRVLADLQRWRGPRQRWMSSSSRRSSHRSRTCR